MKKNEFIEERKDSFRVHLPFTDQNGKRSFYSKSFSIKKYGSTAKERHSIVRVKTDSSIREISFSSDLEQVLKELCENSIQGYLFMKKDGKLINGDEFSDMLNKTTDGTFRAYTLRHQLTTDLLQQNTDLRTIMELMGHSESTMTLYYARSNDQKKREAIENRIINDINEA